MEKHELGLRLCVNKDDQSFVEVLLSHNGYICSSDVVYIFFSWVYYYLFESPLNPLVEPADIY